MNDSQQTTPDSVPLSAAQQEEFVRLLNGSHRLLLRYAMSLLSHRHDAEDVLQKASVTMWRRFSSFEQGSDFIAWATTIVFYETRNFLRVMGRSRLRFDDELLQILAAERAQQIREWPARAEALEDCMQQLPTGSRELVRAIYHDGLSVAEVASRDGGAAKTIYNKLSFIRRALAVCVQGKFSGGSA